METRLLYFTSVLFLGVVAQWLAWRLRLPAILLLLGFGFASGLVVSPAELIGTQLVYPIVSLSVAVVLFEGGLSLRLSDLREVGDVILRLVSLGVVVTWLLSALAAWVLLDFIWPMALLLGAIVALTGPTVIIPLLQHVRPTRRVGAVAKWEGIVIDPVAATLAVLVLEVIRSDELGGALPATLWHLVVMIATGTAVGLAVTAVAVQMLRRYWLPDYLQNSFLLTAVVGAFALSNMLQSESGLIAVTLFGVLLANQKSTTIKHLVEFKENLRVLLISSLFIVLASMVGLEELSTLGWGEAMFLVALLVIRPIAVFAAAAGSALDWRERVFLSCLAPRGIVAATVAALFGLELVAGADNSPELIEQAGRLVPVVFSVIVGTVVIYGLASGPLARRLGIAEPNPQGVLFVGGEPFVRRIAEAVQAEGFPVLLVDTNHRNVAAARMANLPSRCASILSEYVRDEIDLGGIGRLLAMTGSTEVNTLATMEFATLFGRSEVYQLPVAAVSARRQEPVASHQRARPLFGQDATFALLSDMVAHGAVVKKTRLSNEFSFQDFRALYGEQAIVLFQITSNRQLIVGAADQPLNATAGTVLLSLVHPKTDEINSTSSDEVATNS